MKVFSYIIFGFAALAQWAIPLAQIWTQEQTLAKGTLIKLNCAAPDPYDPLRGRFLAVRPTQFQVALHGDINLPMGAFFYGALSTGADGLATVTSVSLTPPGSGDYIRLKSTYSYNDGLSFQWPFNRYYLNEKLAPGADRWFAETARGDKRTIAEVRVLNGRAVLAGLSLDGKPIHELLKERVK